MEIYGQKYEYMEIYRKTYKIISSVRKFPFASASGCKKKILLSTSVFFRHGGDAKPVFYMFKLLLWPWDLSQHVERQKLMANSWEEMSVRVQKGGFVANLFLR